MTTARDLLELIAEYLHGERGESRVPHRSLLTLAYQLPAHVSVSDAWQTLRLLQESGLIIGAPNTPRGWCHRIRLTIEGWAAIGRKPPRQLGRIVYVVPIEWRCNLCGAVTINATRSCRICRLLERSHPEPIFYVPAQGAA